MYITHKVRAKIIRIIFLTICLQKTVLVTNDFIINKRVNDMVESKNVNIFPFLNTDTFRVERVALCSADMPLRWRHCMIKGLDYSSSYKCELFSGCYKVYQL